MALVGNILLGTGSAPGMSSIISSIASAYAESAASSRIPWSALEYSGQTITAISGSSIGGQGGGGGVTPEEVSAIASAYADVKLDKTASAAFQPSGDYAYNSSLTGYLQNSASSTWYPMVGNPSSFLTSHQSLEGYVPVSAISSQSAVWDTVTAKADATAVHTYTGVSPVVVDNTTDQISLSASSIHLDTSLRSYVSGTSGFIGMAYPMEFIGNSSDATGANILYVVLGG